jgi:hypothetical protein
MMSQHVIDTAKRNFGEALKAMCEQGTSLQAFDLGQDTASVMWSVMFTVSPKTTVDETFARLHPLGAHPPGEFG